MIYLDRSRLQGAPSPRPGIDWPARFAELASRSEHPALRDYYRAGSVGAQTPLAQVPLVALDFETTGLDPARHGIVSIGLVPFRIDRIHGPAARQWLIRPRRDLTAESVTIHGITHSEIAQAPDLLEVLDDVLSALAGRLVVAHHGVIERDFLAAALRVRIGEVIELPLVDTMALEARIHRQSSGWWERLLGRQPASIRLAQSRARYGLPHYRPHHATTDALACAELLQAQVAHHYSGNVPVGELWT